MKGGSDGFLVVIHPGSVDMGVAKVQGLVDGSGAGSAAQLPGSQAELRDGVIGGECEIFHRNALCDPERPKAG